jgi:hypothetical protein
MSGPPEDPPSTQAENGRPFVAIDQPAAARKQTGEFEQEQSQVAPERNPQGDQWVPGDAPSQSLQWAVQAVTKAGSIGIIGVYPPQMTSFPTGRR